MDYFLYFYNIALVLIYGLLMFLYFQLFSLKKERLYLWVALLFLVYLADEIYYSTLEFLETLPVLYQEHPFIKYIFYFTISIIMLICYRMILAYILNVMPSGKECIFMVLYSIYRFLVIAFRPVSGFESLWIPVCYIAVDLLPYFWFTFLGFKYAAQNDRCYSAAACRIIKAAVGLWLFLCFCCIFQIYFLPDFADREICAEIISVFSVSTAIWHLLYISRRQKEESTEPVLSEEDLDALFAAQYKLTPREMEIFRYLMDGADNAAISEKAVISQSTTKSHIYNIFRKVDIKRRSQAAGKYQEFCNEYKKGNNVRPS